MPQTAFVDEELKKMYSKVGKKKTPDEYEDWRFLACCLTIGLSLDDLEKLQYKDVAKLLYVLSEENKPKKERIATQQDINRLLK